MLNSTLARHPFVFGAAQNTNGCRARVELSMMTRVTWLDQPMEIRGNKEALRDLASECIDKLTDLHDAIQVEYAAIQIAIGFNGVSDPTVKPTLSLLQQFHHLTIRDLDIRRVLDEVLTPIWREAGGEHQQEAFREPMAKPLDKGTQ